MQICLPTGRQRNAKSMRDQRTKHSHIAWTRDLDDVGIEILNPPRHLPIMPPKRQVKCVGLVKGKGEWPSGKLYPGYGTRSYSFFACARMDGQKGKSAVFRKFFKVPARVGDAVHFIVCIREERDSYTSAIPISHNTASCAFPDGRCKSSPRQICSQEHGIGAFSPKPKIGCLLSPTVTHFTERVQWTNLSRGLRAVPLIKKIYRPPKLKTTPALYWKLF